MSDYTWPTEVIPSSTEWRLISNTAAFVSPLSGTVRTLSRGGDRWACSVTCANLTGEKRSILQAFLARLRGQTHRVIFKDHSYNKRGTMAINVAVQGASQTGSSLNVDGGTPGGTLKAGDWIALGYNMHMVTTDVQFDGGGTATLTISPPLRSSPADSSTVNVLAPTGRFLLVDNTVSWSNNPRGFGEAMSTFTVELVEDLV